MEINLLQKIIIQKVLKTDDRQLLGELKQILDINDDQESFFVLEKPVVLESKDSFLPGERLPNEVLFYQNVNWLSSLSVNEKQQNFPFSEKQMDSESLDYHLNDETMVNEVLFYQYGKWINE